MSIDSKSSVFEQSKLWTYEEPVVLNFDASINPLVQEKRRCLATCLGMISRQDPKVFYNVNVNNPIEWSKALMPFGLKLAYCPTTVKLLEHYIEELTTYNGLFLIGVYTGDIDNFDDTEKVKSHAIILENDHIIDPLMGKKINHEFSQNVNFPVKRLFRVVNKDFVSYM